MTFLAALNKNNGWNFAQFSLFSFSKFSKAEQTEIISQWTATHTHTMPIFQAGQEEKKDVFGLQKND